MNVVQYFRCSRTSKVNVSIQRAAMVIHNKDNSLRDRCINNLVGVINIYTPTRFTYTPTRGLQVIYTPPIEQSDWSEFTSHGTNITIHLHKRLLYWCLQHQVTAN